MLLTSHPPLSRHDAEVDHAELAVIIPAFNERDGVGITVDRIQAVLASLPCASEIVVVDDGSSDGTAERAREHGARVLQLPTNGGYGAAIKAGLGVTNADWVLIIDADGTYPPDAIPALVGRAAEGDMVVGARQADDTSIPIVRRPAKWLLGRLASYLAGQHIPDLNSGMRLMRRAQINQFLHVLPSGFSFTTTITLSLLCTGGRVVYEPIACRARVGSSKIRPFDFVNFVMLVLRTVVLFNPLKVFLPLGLAMFLVGAAKFMYDLTLWNLSETAVMAFLSAIVVWSVGLLADMIARLNLRPPARP